MIAIELLPSINNRPSPVPPSRDCSFCYSRQGRSVILHSASLRDCIVYSSDAVKGITRRTPWQENRQVHFALQYWLAQDQTVVNAIIENLFRYSLERAESAACIASRPGWTFTVRPLQHNGREILASREIFPGLVERHAAATWRWIHARTAD